jgi:WD40 repeat protein/tetratricopeptide (TPR) repeat protein
MYVASGEALIAKDDFWGGLLWFAEALKRDANNAERAHIHRLRIGSHLRHAPILLQSWLMKSPLNYVEFSPDGNRIVIAGGTTYADNQIGTGQAWVYDVHSGRPLGRPLEHQGTVYAASFSPDGQRVVTASGDRTARIWNARSGEPVTGPLKCDGVVRRAYFSPGGDRVVTAARSCAIWDADTGRKIEPAIRSNPNSSTWFAHYSRDGELIVSTHAAPYTDGGGGGFQVWKARTGEAQTAFIESGGQWVYHAAFSADDSRLVTAGMGKTADIWDVQSGEKRRSFEHPDRVSHAVFGVDGQSVITACRDGKVRLWNTGHYKDEPLKVWHHGGMLLYIGLSPDGRLLASISSDGTARVWDLVTWDAVTPPLVHSKSAYRREGGTIGIRPGSECYVAFAPDGRRLAVVGWEGNARVWELADKSLDTVQPVVFEKRPFFPEPAIVPPSKYALDPETSAERKPRWKVNKIAPELVEVVDLARNQPIGPAIKHRDKVSHVVFSPDGNYLATAVGEFASKVSGQVFVWDLPSSTVKELPLDHPGPVDILKFSPDSRRLAVVTSSDFFIRGHHIGDRDVSDVTPGETRIWDLKTGQARTPPFHKGGHIKRVFFSPDAEQLGLAEERAVTIWNAETGSPVTARMSHGGELYTIRFGPAGRRLVTTGADWTARIWDADSGRAITRPLRHPESPGLIKKGVALADFSPDGRLVATACSGGLVRVWYASTGQPVTPFWRHNRAIIDLAFAEDGKHIEIRSADGTRYRRPILADARPPDQLTALTQMLARRRLDDSSTLEWLTAAETEQRYRSQRSHSPEDFRPDEKQIVLWHQRMAATSEVYRQAGPAVFHLRHLLADHPYDYELHTRLANAHAALNNFDLAVEHFTSATRLDPDDWQSWSRRADLFIRFDRWEQAAGDYERIIERRPGELSLWIDQALLHLAAGNIAAARARLSALMTDRGNDKPDGLPCRQIMDTLLAIPSNLQNERDRRLMEQVMACRDAGDAGTLNMEMRGPALFRQGDPEGAAENIRAYLDSQKPRARYKQQLFLSMCEAFRGNRDTAARMMARASDNLRSVRNKNLGIEYPGWREELIFRLLHEEARRMIE